MKKNLFLSFLISFKMLGQSVTITPNVLSQDGGSSDDIVIKKYNSYPRIIAYQASGSKSSPSNTSSGSTLLQIGAGGYNDGSFDLQGDIIFNATQNWTYYSRGTHILFRTTANGDYMQQERMRINHNGYVGIGLTSPNQILDINGRMRIRHTPGFTSGVWMSNSTNSLSDADGAFIGLENDNQAGIWINNAWRFGFKSNGNAAITGFTQLGNSTPAGASPGATAPAIKTLKLTGTTAGAAGASISVDHGLGNRLKILGYTVLVVGTSAVSYPPEYTYNGGYQYSTTCSNTQILIINSHLNSANIYNKAFTVLITYEE